MALVKEKTVNEFHSFAFGLRRCTAATAAERREEGGATTASMLVAYSQVVLMDYNR